jgi:hypothetical protein
MHRRGSVPFVVEVMRRRSPQNGARSSDRDRKSGSGASGLSVTPLIERERVSNPTIEAAKVAAKWFFSEPASQSARADHRSDRGFIARVEPTRPADKKPAGDLISSPPALPGGQAEEQRSGRILQSLIMEDPIEALLRRETEERSIRRRARGPRAQSVGTKAAVPTDSPQIPAHNNAAKSSTDFTESALSTDIVEPRRKLGRTIVTDPNPAVDRPRDKTVRRRKKKATKDGRRVSSLHRAAKARAGKRRAKKRTAGRNSAKKGVAKRATAKKGAGKVAVARKTTVRKGGPKGSIGRPPLAKKRLAATRTVTTASGRKGSRKIAKTKISATGKTKSAKRARKPAKRRARRSR